MKVMLDRAAIRRDDRYPPLIHAVRAWPFVWSAQGTHVHRLRTLTLYRNTSRGHWAAAALCGNSIGSERSPMRLAESLPDNMAVCQRCAAKQARWSARSNPVVGIRRGPIPPPACGSVTTPCMTTSTTCGGANDARTLTTSISTPGSRNRASCRDATATTWRPNEC